jgi:hypothetical protein
MSALACTPSFTKKAMLDDNDEESDPYLIVTDVGIYKADVGQ